MTNQEKGTYNVGEKGVTDMKTHQTDFSQGSIYRNIMEVAVPMTVAQLLNLLYNIVDGGGPLCAMERGRGNEEEAEYLMGNSFLMLVLTGAVLMVAGLLFYRPVLYLFGASDATFVYAGSYIRIYLLGTLFVMISVGMNPFINSQGFGNIGMFSVLIGAVLNIVLDPLFIFSNISS